MDPLNPEFFNSAHFGHGTPKSVHAEPEEFKLSLRGARNAEIRPTRNPKSRKLGPRGARKDHRRRRGSR